MMDLSRFAGPIEIAPSFRPRPHLRHAILDWDGTISLLRCGWVDIMVDVCVESLPHLHRHEVHAEMLALNGKPSIHQMTRIAELVSAAGGAPAHPDDYQVQYIERITRAVSERMQAVESGTAPGEVMIPGVSDLLQLLADRDLILTLASGTPLPELKAESALLQVAHFFGDRIHGPRDTADRDFSKRAAIHALIAEHGISGGEVLAIGDGPIEISEVKALGGMAIGVAADESAIGTRRFDEFKRRQLLDCGADLIIPDYQDAAELLALILAIAPGN